ncbi:MAG: hypothetical protein OXM55_06975 [Bdellovibrionales bacterium]|nr:hypothetical protein [Bdellovibrionales bacterium]
MKSIMIVILTFLALTLMGCGNNKKRNCLKDSSKEWRDGQCVDKETGEPDFFIITNKQTANVKVASGTLSIVLEQHACVRLTKSQFENLKISTSATTNICDSTAGDKCPDAGHYDINTSSGELQKVGNSNYTSDCKELTDTRYSITNNSDANSVTISSGEKSVTLKKGECVQLQKSQFKDLKIDWSRIIKLLSGGTVCDNKDAAEPNCPSFDYFTHFKIISRHVTGDETKADEHHVDIIGDQTKTDISSCSKKL